MPTIHAVVTQQDHSSSEAEVRSHRLVIDRPEAKGGPDKGPMGGEACSRATMKCEQPKFLRTIACHSASRGPA